MSKETKLIARIKKGYNIERTVFIEKEVKDFGWGKVQVDHKASIWCLGEIKIIEAPTFITLCSKVFATLDAMGLKK